ncbi:MAG: porin family protein [Bacteroidia bacterium]|nr:porin family protein [Bacteroidia bacterium]
MNRLITVIIYLSLLQPLGAQVIGTEVGARLGVGHYFGDLNDDYSINKPGLAGGLIARYSFNRRIAVKANVDYAQVAGDDALSENTFQQRRNLNFESDLFTAGLQLEFNFLPFVHGDKKDFFTPYVFGGGGITYFNPKAEYNNEMIALRELGTEGQEEGDEYDITSMGWIYGGGLKVSLNFHWSINIELAIHQLFTDYLDDVSTTYPDMNALRNRNGDMAVALSDPSIVTPLQPKLGETGRQRGNSANKDSYSIFSVGVSYFLGDLRCPAITPEYK